MEDSGVSRIMARLQGEMGDRSEARTSSACPSRFEG